MLTFSQFFSESGPRIKIVKIRIRGGKVQRRKKVSNVKGYKLQGGTKLVRMSSQERMHRKMGARKGKAKRRSKMARAIMQRKRTMRRRHSMGL